MKAELNDAGEYQCVARRRKDERPHYSEIVYIVITQDKSIPEQTSANYSISQGMSRGRFAFIFAFAFCSLVWTFVFRELIIENTILACVSETATTIWCDLNFFYDEVPYLSIRIPSSRRALD